MASFQDQRGRCRRRRKGVPRQIQMPSKILLMPECRLEITGLRARLPKITLFSVSSRRLPRYDIPHSRRSLQPREPCRKPGTAASTQGRSKVRSRRKADAELDRDESRFAAESRRAACLAGEARPGPPRASRLGDVRLGEFGDGLHDRHGGFPGLLRVGRLRGHDARTGHPVVQPLDHRRDGHHRRDFAASGNDRRLQWTEEADARRLPGAGGGVGGRDVLHLQGRLGPGFGLVHPGQHRGQWQLCLLRRTVAAHRPR